ncbi:MAG: ABC transporter substrate binding protein [Rhodocyclaceae bacterium]
MPRLPAFLRSLLSYALAIAALAGAAPCAAQDIAIVIGEPAAPGSPYAEVAEEIRSRLAPEAKVSVHGTADETPPAPDGARLLVAVGARAAARLAAAPGKAPLLVTLMPTEAFARLAAESRRTGSTRPMSAVHLDQPVGRQLALVRLALPDTRRIGVLLGPASASRQAALAEIAAQRGFHLEARQVAREDDLAPALLNLLPETDLLLALPDPLVFNAGTIQMILLSTYRHQRPLFGFSASYTRAGAVLSLFSTPRQIGAEAADMLRVALTGGRLPPPRYPREFQIAANPHVARSLGLTLDSEQDLLQRLRETE